MRKPFAITLDPGSSLANKTGTWRTQKQVTVTAAVTNLFDKAPPITNNTVYSYNVADATIRYVSKGVASNATKKGWFSRVWEKVTPF